MRKELLARSCPAGADGIRPRLSDRGIGVVLVMLSVLILTVLTAGIVVNARRDIYSSFNYRIDSQAAYVADASLQKSLNWFRNSYSPASASSYNLAVSPVVMAGNNKVVQLDGKGGAHNYPDNAITTSFVNNLMNQTMTAATTPALNGSFTVVAILQSARLVTVFGGGPTLVERWLVTSTGQASGGSTEVSAVIERPAFPVFRYAAFATGNGCSSLNFSSGGTLDSWDSSQGTYLLTQQNSNANLGTNGNLNATSPLTVNGTLSTPYGTTTGSCLPGSMTAVSGGSTTVTGGLQNLNLPPSYPTPPAPSPAPPTINQDFSSCGTITGCTGSAPTYFLAPGAYGNLIDSSGSTVHFSAGTYNINSLLIGSSGIFVVDSGPVILNFAGIGVTKVVTISSGTKVNLGGIPSNFQIIYGGTLPMDLTADAGFNAIVYAPNAPVSISSGGDLSGAVISNTLSTSTGFNIHYDRALMNSAFMLGNYTPTSWSRSAL